MSRMWASAPGGSVLAASMMRRGDGARLEVGRARVTHSDRPEAGAPGGSDRALARLGAITAPVGIVTFVLATALHPGHDPGNLAVVLPEYAADTHWLAIHLIQFFGMALATIGLVGLSSSISQEQGRSAVPARLGGGAAVVALAVYAVNQAVDGVAIKFVADRYLTATPADEPGVLLLADTVRHLEIGTTSVSQLALGVALVLSGLAIGWSPRYPSWLGWAAALIGTGSVTLAVLLASRGFGVSVSPFAMTVTYLLGLWILLLSVPLWRATRPPPHG